MPPAASKVDKETCTGKHLVVDEKVATMGHQLGTILRVLQGEPGDDQRPGLVGGVLLLQQSVGNITSQLRLMSDEHYSSRISELESEIKHLRKGQKFPWGKVVMTILGITTAVVLLAAALLTLAINMMISHGNTP